MNNPFAYQKSPEWYAAKRKKSSWSPSIIDYDKYVDKAKYKAWKAKLKRRYWLLVEKETSKVAHLVPGIEKRSWDGYHIDHKVSISEGFKRGFPVDWVASLDNLRVVTAKLNNDKGRRSVGSSLRKMISKLSQVETRGAHIIKL
jgi:hypothetical protein